MEQIVRWIEATGKSLTTIYITRGHGDYFFGLDGIHPVAGLHRPRQVDKMMAVYGDLGNPCILRTAAQDVFEQSQEASS